MLEVFEIEIHRTIKAEIFPTEKLSKKQILKNIEKELNQRNINIISESEGYNLIEKKFNVKFGSDSVVNLTRYAELEKIYQ